MSTDYHLFLDSDDFERWGFALLSTIDGVEMRENNQLYIEGLVCTFWSELDAHHREVMRDDFGKYGLDVNSLITGTFNKETSLNELMERLYRCAATIVNKQPSRALSLMNTATDRFYVHNSANRLTISPLCQTYFPATMDLFEKSLVIDMMEER